MFIDTHCHIYEEYYDNIDEVINESKKLNVIKYINNGCDSKSNKEVIETINKYNEVYGAIGIHPESVDKYTQDDINFLSDNIDSPKIIAIGEIGLDYYYTKENKEAQIKLFKEQLNIAQECNKPVIIHSREATEDTLNILKEYNLRGVIHSFSGSYEIAKEYIKMGYLIGINGIVTFKNCKLKEILKKIPIENIVLETDSPYLTPVPYRGQKNIPGNVKYIAEYVADLYGVSTEELANITNNNVARVFDI